MAEGNTITDLIARIKAEGDLSRNTGTHSIKSLKAEISILKPILASIEQSANNIENITGILGRMEAINKDAIEDRTRQEDFNEDDRPSPTPDQGGDEPQPVPDTTNETQNIIAIFGGLGLIGSAIATAMGGILGVIQGQYNAIKAVGKVLTPGSWTKLLDDLKTSVANRISALRTGITSRITSVIEGVSDGMNSVRDLLRINPDSAIGKAISGFRNAFNPVTELFTSITETIKGLVSAGDDSPVGRIKSFFNGIVESLGSFGSRIGAIARVVGKVFAPIAIITTAWDTITATIEGWQEDGILGALEGAITGFFTSLVTIPLDLVKSAVAWVLDKLGFDESASVLQSFSFTELFTSIVSSIFDGVSSAVNVIRDLFTFGEQDRTLLGTLGKLQDIVYAPVNMAINFVRGLFGFKESDEPFKLQDLITNTVNSAIDWLSEKFEGVGDVIRDKFNTFADWITGIPDRIMFAAREMFINISARLEQGFMMFGEWFASIPARIKLAALETIRSVPGGRLIVGEDDVEEARSAVQNRSEDLDARLQAIEDRRLEQLSALEREAAASQVVAPTTINNGGSTTTNSTTIYTTTSTTASIDPAMPGPR